MDGRTELVVGGVKIHGAISRGGSCNSEFDFVPTIFVHGRDFGGGDLGSGGCLAVLP